MHSDIALFTIDAEHSRDLDDAIGIARNESGWTVRVAVANPSAYVPIGSDEDLVAEEMKKEEEPSYIKPQKGLDDYYLIEKDGKQPKDVKEDEEINREMDPKRAR